MRAMELSSWATSDVVRNVLLPASMHAAWPSSPRCRCLWKHPRWSASRWDGDHAGSSGLCRHATVSILTTGLKMIIIRIPKTLSERNIDQGWLMSSTAPTCAILFAWVQGRKVVMVAISQRTNREFRQGVVGQPRPQAWALGLYASVLPLLHQVSPRLCSRHPSIPWVSLPFELHTQGNTWITSSYLLTFLPAAPMSYSNEYSMDVLLPFPLPPSTWAPISWLQGGPSFPLIPLSPFPELALELS